MGVFHTASQAGAGKGKKNKKDRSTRNAILAFCITVLAYAAIFGLTNSSNLIICGLLSLLSASVIKIATMPMKGLDTPPQEMKLEDVDDEIARTTVATGLELKHQLEQVRNAINEQGFTRRINDFITVYREMLNMVLKDYEKATKLRKMNAYYLPTIIKLLEGYLEAKKNGASYTEISASREKLFATLDQLVQAATDVKDAMIRSDLEEFDIKREVLDDTLRADGFTDDQTTENLRHAASVAARDLPLAQQLGNAAAKPAPSVTMQAPQPAAKAAEVPTLQSSAPTASAQQLNQGAPVLNVPGLFEESGVRSDNDKLMMQ